MGKVELVDKDSPLYQKQDRFIDRVVDVANRHASNGNEIRLMQSFHDPLRLFGCCDYKYIFSCESKNKIIDSLTLYIDFETMSDLYAVTCGVYIAEEFRRMNKV